MRVSQSINLRVRARGHVTVFSQHFVFLAVSCLFRFCAQRRQPRSVQTFFSYRVLFNSVKQTEK